jgi:hypothetical protein
MLAAPKTQNSGQKEKGRDLRRALQSVFLFFNS